MAKFIVDRKTWFRGKGSSQSLLLNTSGQRCCIGFVGNQCGIPDSKLELRAAIADGLAKEKWPSWMKVSPDTEIEGVLNHPIFEAYETNDNQSLSDGVRESMLIALFAKHGDTLEFIN